MSYSSVETSDHAGQPIELYRFTEGTRKWLYTSADVAVVYLTETYEPYPLKRDAFKQTQELNKAPLDIGATRDLPFVEDSIASPFVGVVQLTIYRLHRTDAEATIWWKGRVDGVRFSGSEVTITASPMATTLKRLGLKRPAQRQCPHSLYGPGCNLADAVWSLTGNLVSHTGATVTSGVFATKANGWWVGGKIELEGVPRFILGHVGDTLTITAAVPGLPQSAAFRVFAGCDHNPNTCNDRFGNILNYGGAPWFPIKNPFTGDSPI